MIKRLTLMLLVFSMLISPMAPMAVYADAIMGNEFRSKIRDKLQPLDRNRFYVNGPDGYVTIREEPRSGSKPVMNYRGDSEVTYPNGTQVLMDQTYVQNGEYWGIMEEGHHVIYPGWIPMDHLLLVYVRDDFNADFQDKFYKYAGNLTAVQAANRLVLWQWPGADREKRVINASDFTLTNAQILYAYKDNRGREWGYVNINIRLDWDRSNRHEWICLSDPENSQIPTFHPAPEPIKWSSDGIYKWTHVDAPDNAVGQIERYSLAHIIKVNSYGGIITFSDVPRNAWFGNAVASAYEYDIIKGKGVGIFDPDGILTWGEALTIASRIHANYKYGKNEGDDLLALYDQTYNYSVYGFRFLYQGAVKYCLSEGLIDIDVGDVYMGDPYYDFETPITRAEMVYAWAKILQPQDMPKQNSVIALPDVGANADFYEEIISFYEAGIIGGVDAQGTFNPNNNITRAEAATIFMNLIDASTRHSGKIYKK